MEDLSNEWIYNIITVRERNMRINWNQDQWMDACAWYQLTTMLSMSYYMSFSHVSRIKHAKGDVI